MGMPRRLNTLPFCALSPSASTFDLSSHCFARSWRGLGDTSACECREQGQSVSADTLSQSVPNPHLPSSIVMRRFQMSARRPTFGALPASSATAVRTVFGGASVLASAGFSMAACAALSPCPGSAPLRLLALTGALEGSFLSPGSHEARLMLSSLYPSSTLWDGRRVLMGRGWQSDGMLCAKESQ